MKLKAIYVFGVIFCLVFGLAGIATGTKPTPPFLSGLWPVTTVDHPGAVKLHYFAKFNDSFGPVSFSIHIDGALGYAGNMSWAADTHEGDSLSREIIVNVPVMDTCGIEIRIDKDGSCLTSAYCYFVTSIDSMEVHRGDPRKNPFTGKSAYAYIENQYTGNKLPYGPDHPAPHSHLMSSGSRPLIDNIQSGKTRIPFGSDIFANDSLRIGYHLNFEYIAISAQDFGSVKFDVTTTGDITYIGEKSWSANLMARDSVTHAFELVIGSSDTCGVMIRPTIVESNINLPSSQVFFVRSDAGLQMYKWDLRLRPITTDSDYVINDNRVNGEELPYGPGHPAPPPKITVHTPSDEEKMHQMEREPLTDADVQHIEVNGEIWARNRGEYKFKRLEQLSHEQYYQELMDKYGDSTSFRVIVDLRDSADYRFVSELTDTKLQKTDSAGFFEMILTKRQLWEVHKKGVHYENLGQVEDENGYPSLDSDGAAGMR